MNIWLFDDTVTGNFLFLGYIGMCLSWCGRFFIFATVSVDEKLLDDYMWERECFAMHVWRYIEDKFIRGDINYKYESSCSHHISVESSKLGIEKVALM